MQHYTVFITVQKQTILDSVHYGGVTQPAEPTALHNTTAQHFTLPWTQHAAP